VSELSDFQERRIGQVITLRASIDETKHRIDLSVYRAVRVYGVPVRVVAERLGLTKQRVYQMVHNGARQLDT
jgi:hypothetical protein